MEELAARRNHHPEPHMPPNMSHEQAWAWAMDNFEALSYRSCRHPQCCGSWNPMLVTLLDGAAFGAERGQKRCREPPVEEPKAGAAEGLWASQEVGGASRRGAQWAVNQPEGDSAHRGGGMPAQSESWNPGRSQKLLRTEAHMTEGSGKERQPSLADTP